jgi:hypothetical protein
MTEKYIGAYGFTEVIQENNHTFVCHGGNMGNTEKHVRENFDAMYYEGAYAKLREHRFARASGSPDYSFNLRVPNSVFNSVVGDK